MASTTIVEHVFLDAQAYESASFNFESKHFAALAKHLESGRLKLVIADITKTEVHKRIDKNLESEFGTLEKVQKNSRVLRSSPLAAAVLAPLDRQKVGASVHEAFEEFLDQHGAIEIAATDQEAAPIFEKYFAVEPPFGLGEKRKEFPDAFVVAALCEWADEESTELFVVSGDELFVKACSECDGLHGVPDLTALLDHVASDDEKLATFIREQVKKRLDDVKKSVTSKFQDLGFHVEDEWGDVELTVTSVDLDRDPEIVDIEGNEATVELQMTAYYDADLSFEDSDTGIWDSEDKRLLFMDQVNETVEGDRDVVVAVRVTFGGTDPDEFEITDVELTEPVSGFGISPSKNAGYPWK